MSSAQQHTDLLALLERYFAGLHHADSQALATVFHPRCQYVNSLPNEFTVLSMEEYRAVLDQRVAPAERGEVRKEWIVSLDVASATLAFAKVQLSMLGRDYTDYLTLVNQQGHWRIMAKIFTYSPTR